MNQETKQKTLSFLRDTIALSSDVVNDHITDYESKKPHPKRDMFDCLRQHARNFLGGNIRDRLIILSGLRGSGKTTLFAQIFFDLSDIPPNRKIFMSLDKVRALGLSLIDVLDVYEKEILNSPFEKLDDPVFLFLDEVQYDSNWALTLKTIYDRTGNGKVCVFATGSAALILQGGRVGTDIARRAQYERLFPMSFPEYMKVKRGGSFGKEGLADDIRKAFVRSANAEELFAEMKSLTPRIKDYLSDVSSAETSHYLKYGGLPFVVFRGSRLQQIYNRIYQVIEKVVGSDIMTFSDLEKGTVARIPEILYTVAHSDTVPVSTLSKNMGLSRSVITDVLKSMERSEMLLKIPPRSSVSGRLGKSSKYTFLAPPVRATLFHVFGTPLREEQIESRLLEDVVALYLHRAFVHENAWSLAYDPVESAADFVITKNEKAIVFEVGLGCKNAGQVYKTMNRINKESFGIVISSRPLAIDEERKVVYVPIETFLLM
ncbi:MAG: ATP-binding protein [Candidatus Kaiserbacteria bacterium]|nr:ATP-binding protein [Candidatus Kaiserbacteria bacterium]